MENPATSDRPIHDLLKRRWSPRAISGRPVPPETLACLFEAARWAPSCYNEQPWRYLVAARNADPEGHARLAGLLVDGNAWAREAAAVLAVSLARTTFARNDKPNFHAIHDLGAASENLCLEAVNQGLVAHQMGGFRREDSREALGIPAEWEPVAMIALGFPGDPEKLAAPLRERERAPRARKGMPEVAESARFGQPLGW